VRARPYGVARAWHRQQRTVIQRSREPRGLLERARVDLPLVLADQPWWVQLLVVLGGAGGLGAIARMWLQIKRPVWRARGFARVRERYGDFGDRGVQDALALEDVKSAVERDHGEVPVAAPNQTGRSGWLGVLRRRPTRDPAQAARSRARR
jgi:hypothetical protein